MQKMPGTRLLKVVGAVGDEGVDVEGVDLVAEGEAVAVEADGDVEDEDVGATEIGTTADVPLKRLRHIWMHRPRFKRWGMYQSSNQNGIVSLLTTQL